MNFQQQCFDYNKADRRADLFLLYIKSLSLKGFLKATRVEKNAIHHPPSLRLEVGVFWL